MANRASWKESRLMVAAVTAAATMALAIPIAKYVILPTQTARLESQTAELDRARAQVVDAIRELEQKRKQGDDSAQKALATVERLEKENKALAEKLMLAQTARLFERNDPYPVGFAQPRIGDPLSKLEAAAGDTLVKPDDQGHWYVVPKHSLWTKASYHFDRKSRAPRISHVVFAVAEGFAPTRVVQQRMQDAFGAPRVWKQEGYYAWDVGAASIYLNKFDRYVYLAPRNQAPPTWPKE